MLKLGFLTISMIASLAIGAPIDKFVVWDKNPTPPPLNVTTLSGEKISLIDFSDKTIVLNFWATWCAPCRKEMPMLSELQTELGGSDFEVITIATGKNDPAAMARFFAEIGISNLPLHTDANSAVAREMGVLGLPATVLIARDGTEVARLLGDADWASDSAKNILKALIAAKD